MIQNQTLQWGLPDPVSQADFYATVPTKRLLAWVVDVILLVVLTAIAVPFTAFTGLFFLPFLYAVISFVYRVGTLSGGSATLGMRLMGIEFRTSRGERFDFGAALLHTVLYTIWISTFVLQLISIAMMLTTARKQGLSDIILGSAAINKPSAYN